MCCVVYRPTLQRCIPTYTSATKSWPSAPPHTITPMTVHLAQLSGRALSRWSRTSTLTSVAPSSPSNLRKRSSSRRSGPWSTISSVSVSWPTEAMSRTTWRSDMDLFLPVWTPHYLFFFIFLSTVGMGLVFFQFFISSLFGQPQSCCTILCIIFFCLFFWLRFPTYPLFFLYFFSVHIRFSSSLSLFALLSSFFTTLFFLIKDASLDLCSNNKLRQCYCLIITNAVMLLMAESFFSAKHRNAFERSHIDDSIYANWSPSSAIFFLLFLLSLLHFPPYPLLSYSYFIHGAQERTGTSPHTSRKRTKYPWYDDAQTNNRRPCREVQAILTKHND